MRLAESGQVIATGVFGPVQQQSRIGTIRSLALLRLIGRLIGRPAACPGTFREARA
jgi:hypothetical protein